MLLKLAELEQGTRRRKQQGGESVSGTSWNYSTDSGDSWRSPQPVAAVEMTGRDRTQEFLSAVQSIQGRQVRRDETVVINICAERF